MRKAGDSRKDTIVKQELLDKQIKGKYNVFCAIDDRLSVVSMWYDNGIFVFNVNQTMEDF